MGRIFNANTTDRFVIPNWFADQAGFWDYKQITVSVKLSHDTAQSGNVLIIKGGPIGLTCDNSSFLMNTKLVWNDGDDQVYSKWASGTGRSYGPYANFSNVVPVNTSVTYACQVHKDSSTVFSCSGSGAGHNMDGPQTPYDFKSVANYPWYFFPVNGYSGDYTIEGVRDMTIDATHFNGTLESITTTITHGDGSFWSYTRDFSGGANDLDDPAVWEPLPTYYSISSAACLEGEILTFTVGRSGNLDQGASVTVVTQDISAKDGIDYEGLTTGVYIAPGDSYATVQVQTNAVPGYQGTRTLLATISGVTIIKTESGIGTITDLEVPVPFPLEEVLGGPLMCDLKRTLGSKQVIVNNPEVGPIEFDLKRVTAGSSGILKPDDPTSGMFDLKRQTVHNITTQVEYDLKRNTGAPTDTSGQLKRLTAIRTRLYGDTKRNIMEARVKLTVDTLR